MDTYAAFKQRSDALRLTNYLRDIKIVSTVMNNPNRGGGSCGLCVLFDGRFETTVRRIITDRNLRSFYGFFKK